MREEEYFELLKQKWERIWPHPSLPKEPIYPYSTVPIHNYLEKHAQVQPEKEFIIYYGKRITYKQMDELSNKFANYLIQSGLNKGDKVALILPNMPEFYIGYFGTFKAGGVCVFLNPMLKQLELEHFFTESSPKFILTLDIMYPLVQKAVENVLENGNIILTSFQDFLPDQPEIKPHSSMELATQRVRDNPYLTEVLNKMEAAKPHVSVSFQDVATMNFTGGTTGLPKGVYHKHEDIVYTGAGIYTYYNAHLLVEEYSDTFVDFQKFLSNIAKTEINLAVMPIFWVAGNDVGVVWPTIAGATVVLLTRWDVNTVIEVIEKYRVTTMYVPFDLYWEIILSPMVKDHDLTSLRCCMGSSFIKGLNKELRSKWKDLTGTILREAAYGLTETHTCDTFVAGFHKDDFDIKMAEKYKATFCGLPIPNTHVKIVDENGNIVPFGEHGEILIKSPAVVQEYVNRPEETKETFKDGWLCTGDIGMYDNDGFLYYISRKKYMLKVSGISVYPSQIENIMLNHPAIEMVAVIGADDPKKGQVPIAFVKLLDEYEDKVDEQELILWCKNNMAPYNVPQKIIIEKTLPTTPTGKVIREELVKKYRGE